VTALLLAVAAPGAVAQTAESASAGEALEQVLSGDRPPPGRRRTVDEVTVAARKAPKIRRLLAGRQGVTSRAYLREPSRWQVSFFVDHGEGGKKDEIGQVLLDDRSGRVLEAWTGIQVEWMMARGYDGAFGRGANALYVWLPLLGLFLLPFLRPPWRLLHLDLAVLASLSVSVAFFNDGRIGASVPLAYPPLVYLLVRLLALARSRGRPGGDRLLPPLRLRLSAGWLGIAAIFLLGFRLGMQVSASNVIDVGYAGVIGADRMTHGLPLYGGFPADNARGDTYGPLNYLAYVPFELVWPWHGEWDDLPAAHAAAATFDLACVALLWLIGRRLSGPRLGILLAYLWLACPLTLMAANSGANDPLVGALVLAALAASASPAGRGAAVGAAAMTKFAPLALLPLFALHRPPDRAGRITRTGLAVAAVVAAGLVVVVLLDRHHDLATFADRTLGFQADRSSPFSIWGLYDLGELQRVAQLAGVALALVVAVLPRRRDLVSLAALAAAVLLALQLGVSHWFYFYLAWMIGPLLVALLGGYAEPEAPPEPA
jgi:hypothetical protein